MASAELTPAAAERLRHPTSACAGADVGPRTGIAAFARVLPGARIGADCELGDHVLVEGDVVIGDRVKVGYGVAVWDGLRIEDDVLVGPGVTFANGPFTGGPSSDGPGAGPFTGGPSADGALADETPGGEGRRAPACRTTICAGVSLGANCTILPGLTVGLGAMVGAGSVLTRDVPPYAMVAGNPAGIVGYADTSHHDRRGAAVRAGPPADAEQWPQRLRVDGVSLHRLTRADDLRGSLVAAEVGGEVPFAPRRFFTVMKVPSKDVRGAHAHRLCEQFLVCQAGCVAVVVDDGQVREEVLLDDPGIGLYVPPFVWGIQYRHSSDALLLVLASRPYEPDDYIRDYSEFLRLRKQASAQKAPGEKARGEASGERAWGDDAPGERTPAVADRRGHADDASRAC